MIIWFVLSVLASNPLIGVYLRNIAPEVKKSKLNLLKWKHFLQKKLKIQRHFFSAGSLQDILEDDDLQLEWNFRNSLVHDLVKVSTYIWSLVNGILFRKLFWHTARKNCSSDLVKTFEISRRKAKNFEITRMNYLNSAVIIF